MSLASTTDGHFDYYSLNNYYQSAAEYETGSKMPKRALSAIKFEWHQGRHPKFANNLNKCDQKWPNGTSV